MLVIHYIYIHELNIEQYTYMSNMIESKHVNENLYNFTFVFIHICQNDMLSINFLTLIAKIYFERNSSSDIYVACL